MITKNITTQLRALGFNRNEIVVYVALTQLGESHATMIAKKAGLPRTTTLSILQKMEHNGFVSIHRYKGRRFFWIESPHMIAQTFKRQVKIAEDLGQMLADLYRSEADFPYAKIYDSKASIKTFIEKTLLALKKNTEILTIENPLVGNYQKIISEDFISDMMAIKRKRQITTKTLVTCGAKSKIRPHKLQQQDIILREMPKDLNFGASFWIIDDMLVLFSGKYPFIVAINHRIIAESMKNIFLFLWRASSDR